MKRILTVGVLAALVAGTAQGQVTGLTAAGSNFTGPGGGGGGATSTVGAFLPVPTGSTVGTFANGLPLSTGGFTSATAPTNISVGGITVSVSAAAQQAVGNAVVSGNVAGFVTSLGGAMPAAQAQALGSALSQLGAAMRGISTRTQGGIGNIGPVSTALNNAIAAFNAAVSALPAGSPVPPSLIAARALISGYYGAR